MQARVLSCLLLVMLQSVGCSKHESSREATARHLAGLCNALVGYYENNGRFPEGFESLSRDPKGQEWGGDVFMSTPDGRPVRLVLVDATSMRVEVCFEHASNESMPEWLYSLHVDIVNPTNHNWRIGVGSSPDKALSAREIRGRIMKSTEWLDPVRSLQVDVELTSYRGIGPLP
jgi:hypothetical protein